MRSQVSSGTQVPQALTKKVSIRCRINQLPKSSQLGPTTRLLVHKLSPHGVTQVPWNVTLQLPPRVLAEMKGSH